jgi:hypothetical protein
MVGMMDAEGYDRALYRALQVCVVIACVTLAVLMGFWIFQ